MFLLQCYTGLRYSDLVELEPENFDSLKGIITSHAIKTGSLVRIPMTPMVKKILAEYPDLKFPFISNQKQNDYIKEICAMAGIKESIIITRYRGTDKIEEVLPKYKAIGTHTARRTFVTVSLKRGIAPELVMKVSGHTSRRQFEKYVRFAEEEAFEEMNKAWK